MNRINRNEINKTNKTIKASKTKKNNKTRKTCNSSNSNKNTNAKNIISNNNTNTVTNTFTNANNSDNNIVSKKKTQKNNVSNKHNKSNKSNKSKIQNNVKKQKNKHLIRNFFIVLFLILIIICALFFKKVQDNGGGIQGVLCTILGQSVDNLNDLETFNILLLGISEDINAKLTDTIIVCSYNPKDQSAYLLSIPRDTFVGKNKNTAKGSDKINSIYSKYGINKLLDIINNMLDMDIKYYAVINNNALISLIDATRCYIF